MSKIIFLVKKEIFCFDLERLLYITSEGRIARFHSFDITKEFYMKLDEVMELLPSCYLRCHQRCIVNMNYIEVFGVKDITLADGTVLNISRSRYDEAKKIFLEYIKETEEI